MTALDPVLTESMALPPPEPPPEPATGPGDWVRRNLFRTWGDGIITVVAAIILGYVLFRLGRFVLVTGRWEIIQRNLTLFMVGRYPRDELWRIGVGLGATQQDEIVAVTDDHVARVGHDTIQRMQIPIREQRAQDRPLWHPG